MPPGPPAIGPFSRALIAAASLSIGASLGVAQASAHVHADIDEPVQGESATVTFRVPNESGSGSPTIGLSVALPNLTAVSTAVMPGWTVQLDQDKPTGTVRSITWSAEPGNGIGADQFGLFVMRVKLPDSSTVTLPATQTYADGTVVHWDQAPLPGGEPDHPAPSLALSVRGGGHHADGHPPSTGSPESDTAASASAAAVSDEPEHVAKTSRDLGSGSDNVARGLGGVALLMAALGVAVAVARRERT